MSGWTDLVCLCGLILYDGPGLSIITVSNFEGCDKLDVAKVFGPLSDDSCDLLGRLQVHLKIQIQYHFTNAALGKPKINMQPYPFLLSHLQPLRAVVGGSGPGIGLALFVQSGIVRIPGEGLDAPGPECAGGRDLAVRHQAGLQAHRL